MRRRGRKRELHIPTKYLLIGISAILFLLMMGSFIFGWNANPVTNVVSFVFIPMQKGLTSAGNWISDYTKEIADLRQVREENKVLQDRINDLTTELNSIKLDQYDVEDLRKLLALDDTYSDYNKVAANVISQDAGNWFASFIIDKGAVDGIEEGMNVITQTGLVGMVSQVGTNYSKVLSIIDDTSSVSAMVLSTSDNMIVSGSLEDIKKAQVINFSNLSDLSNEVSIGDQVVTSYISDRYVQGLLIGYISEINDNSNNMTKSGKLTPAVDFEHIKHVYVITDKKEPIDIFSEEM